MRVGMGLTSPLRIGTILHPAILYENGATAIDVDNA
jgi:hypothetical protein